MSSDEKPVDEPIDEPVDTPVDTTVDKPVSRRRVLEVLGTLPFAGAAAVAQQTQTPPRQTQKPKQTHESPNQPAADTKLPPGSPAKARFFSAKERRTLTVLADDIIPRDARSGSATEAGAIDYIEFNLSVEETSRDTRTAWHGGLRWIDTESRKRFGVGYADASASQRHQILDDISWPDRAKPEHSAGVAFFNRARDWVAAGFFTSKAGWDDLRYIGNVARPEWNGCPPEALRKLGVSYDNT